MIFAGCRYINIQLSRWTLRCQTVFLQSFKPSFSIIINNRCSLSWLNGRSICLRNFKRPYLFFSNNNIFSFYHQLTENLIINKTKFFHIKTSNFLAVIKDFFIFFIYAIILASSLQRWGMFDVWKWRSLKTFTLIHGERKKVWAFSHSCCFLHHKE